MNKYVYVYAREGITNWCQRQKVTDDKKKPARVRMDRNVRKKIDAGDFIETILNPPKRKKESK